MSEKYDTLEVAAKALYAINEYGFVSKKNATDSNPSTAHMIASSDPALEFYSSNGVTNFVSWVNYFEPKDHLFLKGKMAFQKEYMADWEIPFAVILTNKYLNDIERDKKIASEKEKFKNSEYQGYVSYRGDFFIKLYDVKKITTNDNQFYLHTFHDRNDNVYTILKPNRLENIEIGDCILIRATVKQHRKYNGIKQTNLNRPNIKQNVGKRKVKMSVNLHNDPVWLRKMLRKYALEVTFTKKNGEERVMNCTLNMSGIPQEQHPKGTGGKEKDDDHPHINVFDLDKGEWRSFHAPSLNDVVVKDTIDAGN